MTKIRTGLGGTIAVACSKYPRLRVTIMDFLQASTSDQVYRGNWQADQIQQITDCMWEILVGKPKAKHDMWMARISKTVKFITIEIMQASLTMRAIYNFPHHIGHIVRCQRLHQTRCLCTNLHHLKKLLKFSFSNMRIMLQNMLSISDSVLRTRGVVVPHIKHNSD
jgi:hypothetical protein